ncbi:MAG: GTPase, partial [Thermodesulfobacteriota bacterium]
SFANLERNVALVGLDFERTPLVVQFNKRDLPDIVPEREIRSLWDPTGIPVTLASAREGWGVLETFREAAGRLYDSLDRRIAFRDRHGLEREAFVERLVP